MKISQETEVNRVYEALAELLETVDDEFTATNSATGLLLLSFIYHLSAFHS